MHNLLFPITRFDLNDDIHLNLSALAERKFKLNVYSLENRKSAIAVSNVRFNNFWHNINGVSKIRIDINGKVSLPEVYRYVCVSSFRMKQLQVSYLDTTNIAEDEVIRVHLQKAVYVLIQNIKDYKSCTINSRSLGVLPKEGIQLKSVKLNSRIPLPMGKYTLTGVRLSGETITKDFEVKEGSVKRMLLEL